LDDNPQPQSSNSGVKSSHKKRWILVGGVLAILILVGVASWWLLHRANTVNEANPSLSQKVAVAHVCSPELVAEANAPLAASDQTALGIVVDKVTALKDYDRDPNCLYIVLQYSLAAGDATASSKYMSDFDRVYDPVVGFSDAFTGSVIPATALRKSVAFLVQNAKQDEASAKLGDDSTAAGSDAADKFQQEHK
jgi:hypothetical protein